MASFVTTNTPMPTAFLHQTGSYSPNVKLPPQSVPTIALTAVPTSFNIPPFCHSDVSTLNLPRLGSGTRPFRAGLIARKFRRRGEEEERRRRREPMNEATSGMRRASRIERPIKAVVNRTVRGLLSFSPSPWATGSLLFTGGKGSSSTRSASTWTPRPRRRMSRAHSKRWGGCSASSLARRVGEWRSQRSIRLLYRMYTLLRIGSTNAPSKNGLGGQLDVIAPPGKGGSLIICCGRCQ